MEEGNTFHYDLKDGWKPIESPYTGPTDVDLKAELSAMGYSPYPAFKVGSDTSFEVEWYRPYMEDLAAHPYLFVVSDSSSVWWVFISDFPSAIELFHKLSTISQAALVNDVFEDTQGRLAEEREKTEEYEHEIDQRRRERAENAPSPK